MCFIKVKWIVCKIQSWMDPLQPLSTKYYKVSARRCSFFVRLSNQAQNWQAVWGVRRGLQRARGRPLMHRRHHLLITFWLHDRARRMGELRLHRYNIYCRGKVRTRTFNRGAKHTARGPEWAQQRLQFSPQDGIGKCERRHKFQL